MNGAYEFDNSLYDEEKLFDAFIKEGCEEEVSFYMTKHMSRRVCELLKELQDNN